MMADGRPLLAAAAAEPLACIRKDREGVEPVIRPLLTHIEENLFDSGLNATSLKRRCGVRDNGIPVLFTLALGRSPGAYIEQRRLETSCRLLAGTGLPVWQIAQLVGYSDVSVFSRAFHRWSGVRPSVYRRESAPGRGASESFTNPTNTDNEIGERCIIQPGPDPAEVPGCSLEVWFPAAIHRRLGRALARRYRLPGNDQRPLTPRDVLITALVARLQMPPRTAGGGRQPRQTTGGRNEPTDSKC